MWRLGITRFWRVAFLRQRKNAECFVYCISLPRALPWAMGNNWAYSLPQQKKFARLNSVGNLLLASHLSPLLQHECALAVFIRQGAEAEAGGAAQVGGERGSIDAQLQAVALLPRSRHGKGGQQRVEG